jgi:hypothetical protein
MAHDGGDGERSHPYQVLLRLVAKKPGITRAKCALALEAKNDSDSELDRIVKLADLEEDEIRKEIGETESNWDNAKKILPRFAEELGDVRKSHGEFFVSDAPGQIGLPGEWLPSQKTKAGLRRPRSSSAVTSETIARIRTPEQWDESEELLGYEVDPEALKARKAKLRSRLMRHNAMVQKLAKCLQSEGAELYENPFDCLACFPTEGVLAEVKSLDGTEKDEIARVRDALGQLLYYESFVTQPLVKGKVLKKVACFESKISDQHLAWLQENDIQVVWDTGKGFDGSDQAKKALSGHLGFK